MNRQLFPQNVIAMIWDFDKTLIAGNMQTPLFRHFDIDEAGFWARSTGSKSSTGPTAPSSSSVITSISTTSSPTCVRAGCRAWGTGCCGSWRGDRVLHRHAGVPRARTEDHRVTAPVRRTPDHRRALRGVDRSPPDDPRLRRRPPTRLRLGMRVHGTGRPARLWRDAGSAVLTRRRDPPAHLHHRQHLEDPCHLRDQQGNQQEPVHRRQRQDRPRGPTGPLPEHDLRRRRALRRPRVLGGGGQRRTHLRRLPAGLAARVPTGGPASRTGPGGCLWRGGLLRRLPHRHVAAPRRGRNRPSKSSEIAKALSTSAWASPRLTSATTDPTKRCYSKRSD
jgi:hypothetical protein